MRVTQNNMLRKILQIRLKDKVKIQDIMKKTEIRNISSIAKGLKLGFARHVVGETEPKRSKLITFWIP